MMKPENVKADIEAAIATASTPGSESQRSVQDKLVDIALGRCSLFRDEQERAFVTFNSSPAVQQHWALASKEFQRTLGRWYYEEYRKTVKRDHLAEACESLAGLAQFEGEVHQAYLRVAEVNDRLYIDLCNDNWQVVEITTEGWCVLDRSPVRFIRSNTMRPLPTPEAGGDINELWSFINVPEEERVLILAWLVESLRQKTQKPILELLGGHGTGKSHGTEILRSLVDPSTAPLRNFPKREEDLFITSQFNWVLTYENQSHLTDTQQDLLCQIATESAFTKRTAYSDADETVLKALRPQIINGITPMATRMDLIDRCVSVELEALSAKKRKAKSQLEKDYAAAYPRIFAALLQLIVDALKILPEIKLDESPRFVDFGLMGTAIGQILKSPVPFMAQLTQNKKEMIHTSLESSPICVALIKLCNASQSHMVFSGNHASLLDRLEQYSPRGGKGWVASPKGLANSLKRHASALDQIGITLTVSQKTKHGKQITIHHKSWDIRSPTSSTSPATDTNGDLGDHSDDSGKEVPQDEWIEKVI